VQLTEAGLGMPMRGLGAVLAIPGTGVAAGGGGACCEVQAARTSMSAASMKDFMCIPTKPGD
jgi:hypothetical protein